MLTARVEHDGRMLALASRYDPVAEAEALVATVDLTKNAVVVVLGVGLGYHVAQLAEKVGRRGMLVVFEPDVGVLRAVLERIDHTAWLGRPNIVVADAETDRAALIARMEHAAVLMAHGTVLLSHPPTRQRCGPELVQFSKLVAEVLAYFRTNLATAFVNSSRNIGNLAHNLAHYAAGASTDELHQAAAGYPAVCVGAGPSLARNVHLLADPAVRKNVIIISAQTTLKPLLERGIRPDFVTALDYHEISRRFYEGLPPLPDVTLVAEAKAHPSIIDSFPGPVRVTKNRFLDLLVGQDPRKPLRVPQIAITEGSTVAHLSFYLAQHLGCDPIALIGQDLGFSDGLYYCPGTAIHDVWLPELGPFNTLEMMEWKRIVRHRVHLRKRADVNDRPIYSDEQMLTYLGQFERDFAKATQTVIDASEGGLPKEGTERMPLAEVVATYATRARPALPVAKTGLDGEALALAGRLLDQRSAEVTELRQLSERTLPLLRQMLEHQRDAQRMNRLFAKLEPMQRRVDELHEAFSLVNHLNTVGAFKRSRADRAIDVTDPDPLERQRRQLERDVENVDWLIQVCDAALQIFASARQRLLSLNEGTTPQRRRGAAVHRVEARLAEHV